MRLRSGKSYSYKGSSKRKAKKPVTVQTVKRLIDRNIEDKFFESTTVSALNGNTASISCLNKIAQGNDTGQRHGRSIRGKWLKFQADLTVHASNTVGDMIRIIIVRDKENTADTAPTMVDLNPNAGTVLVFPLLTTTLAKKRFDVLYDKIHKYNTTRDVDVIRIFKKLGKKEINFNGTADTDFDDGSLYVMAQTNDNTNKMVWNVDFCLCYEDA